MTASTLSAPFDAPEVQALLELALREDLGPAFEGDDPLLGDVTSLAVPRALQCEAALVVRQEGVVAGLPLAVKVLERLAPGVEITLHAQDGDKVAAKTTIASIRGSARGVLVAERTLLNVLQRLSGIATATRRFVDVVEGTRAQILDTRKTLPGWRALSKYAVRVGGGANHRQGLYDQVLLKDNHLAMLGGEGADALVRTIEVAREAAPAGTPLEVEVTSLDGALAAARAGADQVLLDNFTPAQLAEACQAVRADAEARGVAAPQLEASGGIELDTVRAVAESGVDRISTGWITHSSPALDIALDFTPLTDGSVRG